MTEEKERSWERWNEEGILEELEAVWKEDMWIVDVVKDLLPATTDTDKVLDVGCGTGRFSTLFSDTQYIGIDTEPKMIERAKRLCPTKTFQIGDVYHLEFDDNEFELVLCNAVLHHIPKLEPALDELWRVTNKYLCVSFICGQKNQCRPQWRGFLSHMITFGKMMSMIYMLNPKPQRITIEYIDLWAHGTIAVLHKQRRDNIPSDGIPLQW